MLGVALVGALLLASRVAAFCPDHCRCFMDSDGYKAADCSVMAFLPTSPQPAASFIDVITLRPSSDPFYPTKLFPTMFASFRNLKFLHLSNRSISILPNEVFSGLNYVIEIDLSFNKIRYLNGKEFKELPSLQTLDLRGNPLLLETPITSSTLRELDLGECRLKFLPQDTFFYTEKLTHLTLDGNSLTTLSDHSLPRGLRYLNLSRNKIVNVPYGVLSSLPMLRRLDISGNPVNCTCHLLLMQDWFSGRGISFENHVRCFLPPHYRDQFLHKIDEDKLCRDQILDKERELNNIKFAMDQQAHGHHQMLKRHHRKQKFIDHSFQSDQPTAEQSEVLFTDEGTESLGSHMEMEAQDSYDAVEEDKTKGPQTTEAESVTEDVVKSESQGHEESEEASGKEDIQNGEDLSGVSLFDESEASLEEAAPENEVKGTSKETKEAESEREELADPVDFTEFDPEDGPSSKLRVLSINDSLSAEMMSDDLLPPVPDNTTVRKEDLVEGSGDIEEVLSQGASTEKVDEDVSGSSEVTPILDLPSPSLPEEVQVSTDAAILEKATDLDTDPGIPEDTLPTSEAPTETEIETELPEVVEEHIEKEKRLLAEAVPEPEVVPPTTTLPETTRTELDEDRKAIFEDGFSPVKIDTTTEAVVTTMAPEVETIASHISTSNKTEALNAIGDTESTEYGSLGSYIVVAIIVTLLAILVVMAACRRKQRAGKIRIPPDAEFMGTELQDMDSLLPKSAAENGQVKILPKNGQLGNGKEHSPGEGGHQKSTEEMGEEEEKVPLRNGGAGGPDSPPLERTTARLTVLHDSIPQAPVFVHKALDQTAES